MKTWMINPSSLEALAKAYGFETDAWLAKKVRFVVEKTKTNVDMVVGYPIEGEELKQPKFI